MSDLQARYWLEARECLQLVRRQNISQPEFWANLLGAIANATMAATPDSIVEAAESVLDEPPPKLQKRVQRRVSKDLGK